MTKGGYMIPNKGILIVYEGISGSGKSEGIAQLKKDLAALGYPVSVAEWNSNRLIRGVIGVLRRLRLLTPTVYSLWQWFGFLIDYWFYMIPKLRRNRIIIADRYVYTGMTRDVVNGAGAKLSRLGRFRVREPDMVVFFDTPPETCSERIQSRGKRLFHPGQPVHASVQPAERDLLYLRRMRDEYVRIFSDKSLVRDTTVLFVRDSSRKANEVVKAYISQKTEAAASRLFQADNRTRGV
jgi:Thymidylate kinase